MFKKFLSIFLACALVLGAMGTVVFAEEADLSIASTEELIEFAEAVNGGNNYSGKYVKLACDLDMSEVDDWTPIGMDGKRFQGTFDGDGHTISNFTSIKDMRFGNAFFSDITGGATIKNITFDNAYVSRYDEETPSGNVYGIVSGYAYGNVTFENITVKNSKVVGFGKVGAILGMAADPGTHTTTVRNCKVENTVIKATYESGGLVGLVQNLIDLSGSSIENVTWEKGDDADDYINVSATLRDNSDYAIEGAFWADYIEEYNALYPAYGTFYTAYCNLLPSAFLADDVEFDGKTYEEVEIDGTCSGDAVAKIGTTEYASLADAFAAAEDGNTITLLDNIDLGDTTVVNTNTVTLDLNGKTIRGAKADKATSGHELLLNKGNLTIVDNAGDGKITYEYTGESTQFATATNVITNNPGAILNVKSGTLENKTNVASHATYVIDVRTNGGGGDSTLVINGGTILSTKVAAIRGFANSTTNTVDITINDGDITGYAYIQDPNNNANKGKLTVNDGTFKAVGDNYAIYQYGLGDASNISTTINGGTFDGTVYITGNSITNNFAASITDGKFNGSVWVCAWNNSVSTDLKAISGGYFTENPSEYLADGYVIENSDESGYIYKVVEKNEKIDVETSVAAGDTTVNVENIDVDHTLFGADAADIEAAAAATLANDDTVVGNEAAAKEALGVEDADTDTTVSVVVEPYLDIKVTEYNEEDASMTLEIEALYNVVAVATTTEGEEVSTESVVLKEAQEFEVKTPMTITVGLPDGFANDGDTVYIHHTKDNGTTYVYEAAVTVADGKTTATFTNPNGFSKFEVKAGADAAGKAQIGDAVYATLADAVANVEDGETIVLLANNAETDIKVAREITFSVDKDGFEFDAANITASSSKKLTATEDGDIITYEVKNKKTNTSRPDGIPAGGNANQNPSEDDKDTEDNTEDNNTEDTAEPTVPEDTTEPTETLSFVDVASDFWGYEGIAYCAQNGIMNGMSEAEFEPNTTMTRAMLVTMLYRVAGSPEVAATETEWYSKAQAWAMNCGISDGTNMTGEITREQLAAMLCRYAAMIGVDTAAETDLSSFTDMAEISDWSAESIKWAVANGFVNGMGDGTLSPKSGATRAQVATIFMRAADILK